MHSLQVLMVEDNKADQMGFKLLVKENDLPYNYALAGSLSEAKKLLQCNRFDIIISDYFLGDGTAFDILNLKTDTPVIVITGAGDEEIAVRAMKAGAYDYLIKDIESNHLKVLPITVENAMKRKHAEEERERLICDLQQALAQVKTLSGLLPICAACKKIRDDSGYWNQIEAYLREHSQAEFTHSICPDCLQKLYGEV
jgi:DNA-binding NtrC family response regulator